ncbi:uncharacterized protein LOC127767462 isoform X1 [Oryza glaberrima]|uniref:uncharacterized protein LOC127767462 isoform X1 n=1 Tax=Oryza glaberrima TaxID=4538 RepID=UPI00224C45E7|nr:uncharacterized protein LOC127767462 isoform X1 [Oryza glaberrima]
MCAPFQSQKRDIMGDGSSTGWTDEKHMLYINSLEESFVTQLNDGKVSSKGGHDICEGNRTDTIVAQVYLGMDEVGGAASRASQAEFCIGSASCYRHQEDSKSYFMGGDASTTEPIQERISYHAKQKSHGASSASSFHWHGQSPSWTTAYQRCVPLSFFRVTRAKLGYRSSKGTKRSMWQQATETCCYYKQWPGCITWKRKFGRILQWQLIRLRHWITEGRYCFTLVESPGTENLVRVRFRIE